MYQFNKRVNSLTLNQNEIEEFNVLLEEYQTKKAENFLNIKELFSSLLADAINENNIENNEVETLKTLENNIILEENQVIITISDSQKLDIEAFNEFHLLEHEQTIENTLKKAIDLAMEIKEPVEVEKELIKEVQKPLSENEILIELSDDEIMIVEAISQNRAKALKNEAVSRSEMVHQLALAQSTVFNWSGSFYTGLK